MLVPEAYAAWLVPTLGRFSQLYGIPLDLDVQPLDSVLPAILADAQLPAARQHAVWLATTLATQHLADSGMAADIRYAASWHAPGESICNMQAAYELR